jgi:hypothetical protein
LQRDLLEQQHEDESESGDRRGDQEHGLQRVCDCFGDAMLGRSRESVKRLGARLEALRIELAGGRRHLAREPEAQPVGEHRSEECHAERATESAE